MKNIFTIPAILLFICAALAINSCSDEPIEPIVSNELPVVYIMTPLQYSLYLQGDEIIFQIVAFDRDGTIEQIEILLNGTSIATLNSEPYEYRCEIKILKTGDYKLEAIATDDKGAQESAVKSIIVLSEEDYEDKTGLEEFTDPRDGNTYRYLDIGNQTWMVDNLAYLPKVYPPSEGSDIAPYYYVYGYNGNSVIAAKQSPLYSRYGVLYNWEAAKQAAPEGWHLPTQKEWEEFIKYTTGDFHLLLHPDEGGTNIYGFSAKQAGWRDGDSNNNKISYFRDLGSQAMWRLDNSDIVLPTGGVPGMAWLSIEPVGHPAEGYSIRCIKD